MSTMIPRSKLEPHPDNPRRELGDLEELAASIKARGVLQNLTVVPSPGDPEKYRVIIGHRRLAASAIAGLDELPCAIVEMSHADQIATMMTENMQRNDLTISDQVGGVQTMMDLGEDVKGIVEKTGLSSTTIRRRVKLGELNQPKLKEAEARGATLMDLIAVSNLTKPENRDYVLEAAGTNNFSYRLSEARSSEKVETEFEKVRPQIEEWAKIVSPDEWNKMGVGTTYVRGVTIGAKDADYTKPKEPKETGKYVFVYRGSQYATVYEIMLSENSAEDNLKRQEHERKRQKKQLQLDACEEMRNRAYALRLAFMEDYHPSKEHTEAIMEFADYVLVNCPYDTIDGELATKILDARTNPSMLYKLALHSWLKIESKYNPLSYDDHGGKYKDNDKLNMVYASLTSFGYQMSDEEADWNSGRHKCFTGPFIIDEEDAE